MLENYIFYIYILHISDRDVAKQSGKMTGEAADDWWGKFLWIHFINQLTYFP